MRKLKRMIRENLNRTAPDHLYEIIGAPETRKSKKPIQKNVLRLSASLGAAAAVLALSFVGLNKAGSAAPAKKYASPQTDSEQFFSVAENADETYEYGAGGRSGDGYAPVEVKSEVELPDGKTFSVYTFEGDYQKGKELLELIIERSGVSFDTENVNYADYESRPGADDAELLLWGNLDEGMFYYQNMIQSEENPATALKEDWISYTKKEAEEIVSALEPYVGKTVLSEYSILSDDAEEIENSVDAITFFYIPAGDYSVDGYETVANLAISFDRNGKVQTLRSDISAGKMYLLSEVTFPENILEAFAEQLGEVDEENAVVTVTDYRIVYTQTIGFDGNGLVEPYVELIYEVNGNGPSTTVVFAD